MATRQNKKQRNRRNNTNNRERTVTTLTEDPNTHYLVPTPSEEPAGAHLSSQFPASGAVGGQMHNMAMGPQSYAVPANFSFGYPAPFSSLQHTNMHQQQQPYYPTSPQQASQQPPATSTLPPGKSDLEILQNLKQLIKDGQHPFYRAIPSPAALASLYKGPIPVHSQPEPNETHGSTLASNSGTAVRDNDRRQPRRPGKDQRIQDKNNASQSGSVNRTKNGPPPSVANLNLGALQISKDGSGPPSAGVNSGAPPSEHVTGNHSVAMDVDRPAHGDPGSVYGEQSRSWAPRGTAPRGSVASSDNRLLSSERDANTTPHTTDSASTKPGGSFDGVDRRPVPGHGSYDQRAYSTGREWYPNDHERRIVYERPAEFQKPAPPPDPVSHKTNFGPPPPVTNAPENPAPLHTQHPEARGPIPVDASQLSTHEREVVSSARASDSVLPDVDAHPPHYTGSEPHDPPVHYGDRLASDVEDVRSSRSSSPRLTANISSIPPPTSAESLPPVVNSSDMPPPSSKEQVNSGQTVPQLVPRQSKPTTEAQPAAEQSPAPHQQERFGKKGKFQRGQHLNGPGKFGRQGTPADGPPPGSGGHGPRAFRPRSPSVDGRKPRDYRGPPPANRDMSRDRAAYRAEYDPRRPEIIDPDVRYDGRPYGEFAPLPAGERRPAAYPASPPPMRGPSAVEPPPSRAGDYYMYPGGRGEWDMDDDEYYKSRGWDRPPPSSAERDRFERDSYGPRPAAWDGRPDREFDPRDAYPPGPPGPPIPLDDRYPPAPPMPRDSDRAGRPPPGAYSAPYGRVRGRSPSPAGRGSAPALDDARPPMKRPREEYPPEYYPGARPPPRRPSVPEYPPPRSGGSDWPPPPSAGSAGSGGPPIPRNRRYDRPVGREPPLEYGAPPYDRPPQAPPGRMPYGPPINDRGGYPPRPPQ